MKKIYYLLPLTLFSLCSCRTISTSGSYVARVCVSNTSSNAFSMDYDYLNGYRTYSFNSKNATEIEMDFDTRSGTLSCVVIDANDKEIYKNEAVKTEDITISIEKNTDYKMTFTATEHSGSFYVFLNE